MEENLSNIYLRNGQTALQYVTGLNAEHKQIVTEAIFECLRLGYPLNNMEITGKAREMQRKRNKFVWLIFQKKGIIAVQKQYYKEDYGKGKV